MSSRLDRYKAMRDKWEQADEAVANNQSYEIDGRKLTRADADAITSKLRYYEGKIARLERGGIQFTRGVSGE